jgi:tyrosine-protein kinase Etk/Wzc
MNTDKQFKKIEEEEIDLAAIFHQMWLNKWIILGILSLSLLIGGLYAMRQIPQYQSNVLLQIDSKQPGFGQAGNAVSQLFLSGASSADSAATQTALIQSLFILDPVINSLGLNLNVSPKLTFWKRIFSPHSLNKLDFSSFEVSHSLLNKRLILVIDKPQHVQLYDSDMNLLLQGNVGELLTNSGGDIRFKVKSITASIGSKFTIVKQSNAMVVKSLLTRLSISEAGEKMRQNTGVLNISLRDVNPEVVVKTLNAIASVTKTKDAEKKAQEAAQTLEFLYKQLPVTKKLLQDAESSLNRYRARSGKIDIKLQTQFLLNQLAELAKQEAELEIKKIEMLQQYTSLHPLIIALNAQIKALNTQEKGLQNELRKLPASDQVALNLMRDVKVKQALYMILLNKIQELQVVKAGTISGVRVLSYAQLPDASMPSKKSLICISSVLIGFLLSFVCIYSRKLFSPRVDDPHWSERHFNIPNLAIVPYSKEQTDMGKDKPFAVLAHSNPRNLAIESLRSLRTSLQVSLACSSNNIISIMGICPGVGKSFISSNLAYLLAAGGKRVLIIDGDLRRGTLHKYFSEEPSPGLSDVLGSDTEIERALRLTSVHQNLTILPRGAYPKDPSELLMRDRFKELMENLNKHYDVIIIDTPPVLLVTDAVLIGGYSSINYLVVGAGVHQSGEMELVIKRLSASGVQLQGTIFNFHRAVSTSQYYGKYYQHSYYYYDDKVSS